MTSKAADLPLDPDAQELVEKRKSLNLDLHEDAIKRGILRGVHSAEILSCFGTHWKANSQYDGSQRDRSWIYSSVVGTLSGFFSHSWSASRALKTLTLLSYFNGKAALASGGVAALLVGMLESFGLLPLPSLQAKQKILSGGEVYDEYTTLWPFCFSLLFFAATFLFGQRMRYALEKIGLCSPQHYFLDKLCIHQSDTELQKLGISSLGAFIDASERFVVLFSGDYLTRLWCSFELAAFVQIKTSRWRNSNVQLLNLQANGTIIALWLMCLLNSFITPIVSILGINDLTSTASVMIFVVCGLSVVIPITACFVVMLTSYAFEHEAMVSQLENYSIENTCCFNEGDREAVYASIQEWFDPSGVDPNVARNNFNNFVRGNLRRVMLEVSPAPHKIPYSTVLVMVSPFISFDTCGVLWVNSHLPVGAFLHIVLGGSLVFDFVLFPFCVWTICQLPMLFMRADLYCMSGYMPLSDAGVSKCRLALFYISIVLTSVLAFLPGVLYMGFILLLSGPVYWLSTIAICVSVGLAFSWDHIVPTTRRQFLV